MDSHEFPWDNWDNWDNAWDSDAEAWSAPTPSLRSLLSGWGWMTHDGYPGVRMWYEETPSDFSEKKMTVLLKHPILVVELSRMSI